MGDIYLVESSQVTLTYPIVLATYQIFKNFGLTKSTTKNLPHVDPRISTIFPDHE